MQARRDLGDIPVGVANMDRALLQPTIAHDLDVFPALALENDMCRQPQDVRHLLHDDLDVSRKPGFQGDRAVVKLDFHL
jgi:hypothetical protein